MMTVASAPQPSRSRIAFFARGSVKPASADNYYSSGAEAKTGIYVMDEDGTNRRYLGPGSHPAWSPDRSHLAYVHDDKLLTMSSDGQPTEVLSRPGGRLEAPAWSRDGKKIAFVDGRLDESSIWTVDADGSQPDKVTGGAVDNSPSWSANGLQLLFSRQAKRGLPSELWLSGIDGSDPHPLRRDTIYGFEPAWSPNGNSIAFSAYASASENLPPIPEVFVLNLDSMVMRQITTASNSGKASSQPDWSADGKRLVYVSSSQGRTEVRTVGATGAGDRAASRDRDSLGESVPAYS